MNPTPMIFTVVYNYPVNEKQKQERAYVAAFSAEEAVTLARAKLGDLFMATRPGGEFHALPGGLPVILMTSKGLDLS